MSVCGYNDTLLARKMIPSLTSVASPVDEMARNAIALLLKEIRGDDGTENVYLAPHLLFRESSLVKIDK